MKRKVWFIALFLCLDLLAISYGNAQVTTLAVDINTATFSWDWEQGTGSAAEEFRIKCGTSSGNHTLIHPVAGSIARSVPVIDVIGMPGSYFCVVVAANQFGESAPSNEVFFEAGTIPAAPSNLRVTIQ